MIIIILYNIVFYYIYNMDINWDRNKLYSQLYSMYINGTSPFKIVFCDMSYGDEYYRETNHILEFKIGDSNYIVGYYNIVEDSPDWAQADSYNGDIFKKDDNYTASDIIIKDLNNYHQIKRDSALNKLLND